MITTGFLLCFLLVAQVYAVTRPPGIFKMSPFDVFYKPGEPVRLDCEAHGDPQPTYTWFRNGYEYNPDGDDARVVQLPNKGTILITKPEGKDEGIYQCKATNSFGTSLSIKYNLREVTLKNFSHVGDQRMYPSLGAPLTLPCYSPDSVPQPDVFWAVQETGAVFTPINYDARVSVDLENRLRFTNVKTEDFQQGRPYVCRARNSKMGQTVTGPRVFVHPMGGTEMLSPARYMWTSPEDHFGLRGSNFTVKCIFSGNPTPDVYWTRTDGAPLPDRAQIQSFGQELMISHLDFDDAGSYECWATNKITPIRAKRTLTIRVESKPDWLEEPRDVEVGVGGTAEFNCLAHAVPEPQYFWYINGVALRDCKDPRITPGRFQQPRPDRIVFSQLTREDRMVIQCNATNKHGYIWGDVYLNVL